MIGYAVDNWLISPQVTLNGTLQFWVHDSGNTHESFDVYVSTTTDDISAFTKIGSGVSTNSWTAFTFDLSSYNGEQGYIAIRHQSEGNPFLAVDDFGISLGDWAWKTGTTSNHDKFRLNGLNPDLEYEVQVRSKLYNTYSKWSDVFTFTTNRIIPLADDDDNTTYINALASISSYAFDVMLQDRTFHKDGTWNTLCVPFGVNDFNGTPLEGAMVKTLGSTDLSNGGTLTLNFTDATSIEAGKPYILKWDLPTPDLIIRSTTDWDTFASTVSNGTESYAGKLVLLGTDISVSTMVGSEEHPFCGTFDGAGHTLNVSINGADYASPFRYINGAVVCNLKVTGSVNGGQYSAGIVGAALGGTNSIRNCWMAASVSGLDYIGGILGHGTTSATTISNCYLSGSLNATDIGILYGCGSAGGTHTIETCWAMGTYTYSMLGGGINLVLTDGGTVNVINCNHNDTNITQGSYSYIVTTNDGPIANFLGSQWTVNDDGRLALKHTTDIANIMNPVFKSVPVTADTTPVETDYVDFIGSTSPVTLTADDRSVLYLDTDNMLRYPAADMTLNACRAYFQLKNGRAVNEGSSFVLNVDGISTELTTSLEEVSEELRVKNEESTGALYDLSGRKMNGQSVNRQIPKGVYVKDGRKVVIK